MRDLEWMRLALEAEPRPVWCGDMSDDCTARWAGLTLRAEWMDDGIWWWAVYFDAWDMQIDSSNEHDVIPVTGEEARKAAEEAGLAFIGLKS